MDTLVESIDISRYHYSKFTSSFPDEAPHVQNLPFLCIVQSKEGRYGISLGDGEEKKTLEGGFYIAPSFVIQRLRHLVNPNSRSFSGRYLFLDVIVNKRYRLEDIYDFPSVTNENESHIFDAHFDRYDAAESVCERMQIIYSILCDLIRISIERPISKNMEIYPLVEYIHEHYSENISVRDMAEILKTSESNLYVIFKRATGTSPIKFLSDVRLSVACGMLHQGGRSIAEIAESVGIPDQFYFSRLFKQRYGLSPVQYRKKKMWR
ncbi:MAG: helix-turn-helix transcriptional regulator [Clostridia bacterium]|nr:helix-turn-helix transcriptional regulator [Clostridia bacterium]